MPRNYDRNEFELAAWYSSDRAKRNFGSICRAVNADGAETTLLGSEERPLILLLDADDVEASDDEIEITIDEAKADWSAVTDAVMLFNSVFRISSSTRPRAVMRRHARNRHPALKYKRASDRDLRRLTERLAGILDDFRQLGGRLEQSADLIERNFRTVWRASQGYPLNPAQQEQHRRTH